MKNKFFYVWLIFFIFPNISSSFSSPQDSDSEKFDDDKVNLLSDYFFEDEEEEKEKETSKKQEKIFRKRDENDEGWRWRKNLNLSFEGSNFSFDDIHQKLAFIESSITSQICMEENKPNIALAQVSFIVEHCKTRNLCTIEVPLINRSLSGDKSIIFRSGRASKDRSFFKTDSDILEKYYIYPPIIEEDLTNQAFNPEYLSDELIKLKTQVLEEKSKQKSIEVIEDLLQHIRELSNKAQKNKEHLRDLEDEIMRRFNLEKRESDGRIMFNSGMEKEKSIVSHKIYTKIKDDLGKSPQQKELLYLHSEQSMLLYFKQHLAEIVMDNFSEVRKAIIPDLSEIEIGEKENELRFGKLLGIVLNLHSRLDFCDRCAPSIAREAEREDSFVAELKDVVKEYIKKEKEKLSSLPVLDEREDDPFFAILGSVRQEFPNKERRFQFGHDGKYIGPIDISKLLPYFVVKIVDPFLTSGVEYLEAKG
jgi:hypothetical protein